MEFLKLLITGGLILIGARIVLTDENSENNSDLIIEDRLPDYIKPKHYDIELTINPDIDFVISGICNITINVERPTQNISLHAHKQYIQILETYLYVDPKLRLKLLYYTYNNESHILTFHFINEIQHGRYILQITFTSFGTKYGEGFFTNSYANVKGDKELPVFISGWTNFYPIGARRVFPCWDEPAMKATFTISIKHHKKYLLLSNTPQIRPSNNLKDDMLLTKFRTIPPISTYQIAIAMLDSDVLSEVIWSRRSTLSSELANRIFNEIMKLGIKEGFHYNNIDVEIIAIPGFQYDITGYWRLNFYRETAIIYDDKIDSVGHKINMARLMAREAARHWFSKISPSWWSDSWLNEGIVRLLGLDAIDKIFPDFGRLSMVQIKHESLHLDTQSIMKPLISQINSPSEINSLFSFSYYIKGPVILQMLQHLLTNETFQIGLHNYLNRHKYDSASVDDFWTAMQDTVDKTKPSVSNLKEKFHAWTYRPHYPVLNIETNLEDETDFRNKIQVCQENINGTNWSEWWLPITYATQTYSFFSLDAAMWLPTVTKRIVRVHRETEDWIIANTQQIGYYRVNYDLTNWLRIVETLNSENYTKIHVLNRAQIIDDAYHLVMTYKLPTFIFLELAKYLEQETDFIAWYPMIKAFEDMSSYFPFPESAYIKDNMRTILDGLLEKIGYEEITNNDISDSLRQEAAKWACILGSYDCTEKANLKLRLLFAHKKQNTLLPYWKHWTYCNGLVDSTWFKMFNKYREEYGSTILKFVACSENVTMICNYLMTSENDNELQDIDRINIFHSIVASHTKNNFILDCILANFEKIKPKEVSTTALLIIIINHVYSKEVLDKLYKKMHFMKHLPETIIDKSLNEDEQDKQDEVALSSMKRKEVLEETRIGHRIKRGFMPSYIDKKFPMKDKQDKQDEDKERKEKLPVIRHPLFRHPKRVTGNIKKQYEKLSSLVKSKIKIRLSQILNQTILGYYNPFRRF